MDTNVPPSPQYWQEEMARTKIRYAMNSSTAHIRKGENGRKAARNQRINAGSVRSRPSKRRRSEFRNAVRRWHASRRSASHKTHGINERQIRRAEEPKNRYNRHNKTRAFITI